MSFSEILYLIIPPLCIKPLPMWQSSQGQMFISLGEIFFLTIFPTQMSLFSSFQLLGVMIRTYAVGFFVSNSNYQVSIAGCGSIVASSSPLAKLNALNISIMAALNQHSSLYHIFTASNDLLQLLNSIQNNLDWRLTQWTQIVRGTINAAGAPRVHQISMDWIHPASSLAIHGRSLHVITPFHHGK